jgi:hypothetical protein
VKKVYSFQIVIDLQIIQTISSKNFFQKEAPYLSKEKIWFKIVEKKNGQYKTLYHGVNKSRLLDIGKWLKSEQKAVRDGSSINRYISGWHILPNLAETLEYLKKFKKKRELKLMLCKAKVVWKKEHSRNNVYLAEKIYILGEYDAGMSSLNSV